MKLITITSTVIVFLKEDIGVVNENFNSYDRQNKRAVQIRQAAYDLITEVPYDDITMAMIAQRAQVAKGTIFNYFNSKEDIFMAIDLSGYLTYCERVEADLSNVTITDKQGLKVFLLQETEMLARDFSVIILIHSLRRFTLEAHADKMQTEQGRIRIYETLQRIVKKLLVNIDDLDAEVIMHTFIIQGAILNGILTFLNMDKFNEESLSVEMTSTHIDFETEVCNLFGLYLDKTLQL